MTIEDGVHGADRREQQRRDSLPQFLADLGRAPAGVLALQEDDRGLDRRLSFDPDQQAGIA